MVNKFKGTINGIDFNNVKDYNAYLLKLIQNNENINAQSSTNIVNEGVNEDINEDEDKSSKCYCGEDKCTCENKSIEWGYVPFFEEGDEYYLDNEKLSIKDITNVFDDFNKTLEKKLADLCPCQLKNYLNTISDIYGSIISDDKFARTKCVELEKAAGNYRDEIKKIQEKLEDIRTKHRRMLDFRDKIDVFNKFYKHLYNEVEKCINNHNECPNEKSEKTERIKSEKTSILDGYTRLLKAILDAE